jgi:hypothetical protein
MLTLSGQIEIPSLSPDPASLRLARATTWLLVERLMLLKPTSFIFRLARQRSLPFRPLRQIHFESVDGTASPVISPVRLEAAPDVMAQPKEETSA